MKNEVERVVVKGTEELRNKELEDVVKRMRRSGQDEGVGSSLKKRRDQSKAKEKAK